MKFSSNCGLMFLFCLLVANLSTAKGNIGLRKSSSENFGNSPVINEQRDLLLRGETNDTVIEQGRNNETSQGIVVGLEGQCVITLGGVKGRFSHRQQKAFCDELLTAINVIIYDTVCQHRILSCNIQSQKIIRGDSNRQLRKSIDRETNEQQDDTMQHQLRRLGRKSQNKIVTTNNGSCNSACVDENLFDWDMSRHGRNLALIADKNDSAFASGNVDELTPENYDDYLLDQLFHELDVELEEDLMEGEEVLMEEEEDDGGARPAASVRKGPGREESGRDLSMSQKVACARELVRFSRSVQMVQSISIQCGKAEIISCDFFDLRNGKVLFQRRLGMGHPGNSTEENPDPN